MATVMQNAATVAGVGTPLTVTTETKATLSLNTSETFDGDVVFEGSLNGTDWFPYHGFVGNSAIDRFSGAKTKKMVYFKLGGLTSLRANLTRITNGSITVVGNAR